MRRDPTTVYIEQALALLIEHFGASRVRTAMAKALFDAAKPHSEHAQQERRMHPGPDGPSITSALEAIREIDDIKFGLLHTFYARLKVRTVLPESQDIRHLAQRIGLKEIGGRSRKDMLPILMRFLIEQPVEQVRVSIAAASEISEEQRRQGFSVITDKLLAGTQAHSDTTRGVGPERSTRSTDSSRH